MTPKQLQSLLKEVKKFNLTMKHLMILMVLRKVGTLETQALAKAIDSGRVSVLYKVKYLADKGLLFYEAGDIRRSGSKGGRAAEISLTPLGQDLLDRI